MNEKKLSIVFVTNNYFPYQGGVVSSIVTTREALQKLGHSVHLITLDFTGDHAPEEGVIRLACPIRFLYKKNHMAVPLFPQTNLDQLVQRLKPDIMHIHHPFLLGQTALISAKNNNIPTVFTYHTLYEQYLHYVPLPDYITRFIVQKRVQAFCNAIDGIVAPGNFVKDRVREHCPQKLVQTIPSSISQVYFKPFQQRTKSHNDPATLLTISRFTLEKNLTFLIDVIKRLENAPVRLILAGFGSHYQYLKSYAYGIKNLPFNKVVFIERPSKEKLLELYREADLFVFASKTDTQGLVLAEAMSQGTPVIALNGPGQQDIIVNGFNGFLVANEAEMAESILKTVSNHVLLQNLRNNAFKTAQGYASSILIEKLIAFYQTVMNR